MFYEEPVTDIFFSVRKGYEFLADELVDYAVSSMPNFNGKQRLVLFNGQEYLKEAAAKRGDPEAYHFPRGKVTDHPYDFTFSGIKSAVLNFLNHASMSGETVRQEDVAASFQQAVVDVLVERAVAAALSLKQDRLVLAGGVACNGALRAALESACEREGIRLYRPRPILCTDNAAMIASAGYFHFLKGDRADWSLNAVPGLEL